MFHATTLRSYAKMDGMVNCGKKYNYFTDDMGYAIRFALRRAIGRDDIGIVLEVKPTGRLEETGQNKYRTTGVGHIKKVIALVDKKEM